MLNKLTLVTIMASKFMRTVFIIVIKDEPNDSAVHMKKLEINIPAKPLDLGYWNFY